MQADSGCVLCNHTWRLIRLNLEVLPAGKLELELIIRAGHKSAPRLARSVSDPCHAASGMVLHPARVPRPHLTAIALPFLRCEYGLWTKMKTSQWMKRMASTIVPCHVVVGEEVWPARSLAHSPIRQCTAQHQGRARHARRARIPASWGWKSLVLPTSQSNKRGALSRPDPNAPNIHAGLCRSLRTQPASHPRATLRLFR